MKTLSSYLFLFKKTDDQLPNEILEEIIFEILARLPIKTLLQFKSVSKEWLSIINNSSFAKLQLTCATTHHRTPALLFSVFNTTTRQRHFLSTTRDGGPATHLITLDARTITSKESTQLQHLNGLVLFTSGNGFIENNFAFVVNPSTRKSFKLSGPASVPNHSYGKVHICYFFGFHELTNEHKILNIRMLDIESLTPFRPKNIEIMIFSMSSYAWRKIDVDLPFDVSGDQWYRGTKHSVCVNSVIHVMLESQKEILTFDLKTEKFSIMNLPRDAIAFETRKYYKRGLNIVKANQPIIMKINGLLGVICHKHHAAVGCKEMCIWVLQDYEKGVWVREIGSSSRMCFLLNGPFPLNPILWKVLRANSQRLTLTSDTVNVPMYDVETRSIKEMKFSLDHQFLQSNNVRFDHQFLGPNNNVRFDYQFLQSKNVRFDHVTSYIESIWPLEKN